MADGDPEMRGRYVKDNLATVDDLGAAAAAAVRARIDAGVVAAIAAAGDGDWLPVALDVAVTEALWAEVGDAGLVAANRRVFLRAVDGPVLGALWDGVRRVAGVTPLSLLRFGPRIYSSVYRGCGAARVVDTTAGAARVVIDDAPAQLLGCAPYYLGICGVFEACLSLTRKTGEVALEVDAAARQVRFHVAWR